MKSQVNPHFLFNSLNSLSCLVHEDPDKAEKFLDELSKVYRYLLRSNNDQLVKLKTELNFINSYYYLLNERYGEGLQLDVDVDDKYHDLMIPPLTLQMIFENVFTHNAISKEKPLLIKIYINEDGFLSVTNNIEPKINHDDNWTEIALENIINKFRLLCRQDVSINETNKNRLISLPLIENEQLISV